MTSTPASRRTRRYQVAVLAGILFIGAVLAVAVFVKLSGGERTALPQTEGEEFPLPQPQTRDAVAEALAVRRSQREFASQPLTAEHVSQLCWAAQGITDPGQGLRTAPSAGALYPLTVFVVDQNGVSEYLPQRHVLRRVRTGDVRGRLQAAALGQTWVGAAPLCLVITMNVERTASKYGSRAERYCLLEAGHVAQNVLLQATALGVVGVPVGAFDDDQVMAVLGLPRQLRPVYLLPLGYPAE